MTEKDRDGPLSFKGQMAARYKERLSMGFTLGTSLMEVHQSKLNSREAHTAEERATSQEAITEARDNRSDFLTKTGSKSSLGEHATDIGHTATDTEVTTFGGRSLPATQITHSKSNVAELLSMTGNEVRRNSEGSKEQLDPDLQNSGFFRTHLKSEVRTGSRLNSAKTSETSIAYKTASDQQNLEDHNSIIPDLEKNSQQGYDKFQNIDGSYATDTGDDSATQFDSQSKVTQQSSVDLKDENVKGTQAETPSQFTNAGRTCESAETNTKDQNLSLLPNELSKASSIGPPPLRINLRTHAVRKKVDRDNLLAAHKKESEKETLAKKRVPGVFGSVVREKSGEETRHKLTEIKEKIFKSMNEGQEKSAETSDKGQATSPMSVMQQKIDVKNWKRQHLDKDDAKVSQEKRRATVLEKYLEFLKANNSPLPQLSSTSLTKELWKVSRPPTPRGSSNTYRRSHASSKASLHNSKEETKWVNNPNAAANPNNLEDLMQEKQVSHTDTLAEPLSNLQPVSKLSSNEHGTDSSTVDQVWKLPVSTSNSFNSGSWGDNKMISPGSKIIPGSRKKQEKLEQPVYKCPRPTRKSSVTNNQISSKVLSNIHGGLSEGSSKIKTNKKEDSNLKLKSFRSSARTTTSERVREKDNEKVSLPFASPVKRTSSNLALQAELARTTTSERIREKDHEKVSLPFASPVRRTSSNLALQAELARTTTSERIREKDHEKVSSPFPSPARHTSSNQKVSLPFASPARRTSSNLALQAELTKYPNLKTSSNDGGRKENTFKLETNDKWPHILTTTVLADHELITDCLKDLRVHNSTGSLSALFSSSDDSDVCQVLPKNKHIATEPLKIIELPAAGEPAVNETAVIDTLETQYLARKKPCPNMHYKMRGDSFSPRNIAQADCIKYLMTHRLIEIPSELHCSPVSAVPSEGKEMDSNTRATSPINQKYSVRHGLSPQVSRLETPRYIPSAVMTTSHAELVQMSSKKWTWDSQSMQPEESVRLPQPVHNTDKSPARQGTDRVEKTPSESPMKKKRKIDKNKKLKKKKKKKKENGTSEMTVVDGTHSVQKVTKEKRTNRKKSSDNTYIQKEMTEIVQKPDVQEKFEHADKNDRVGKSVYKEHMDSFVARKEKVKKSLVKKVAKQETSDISKASLDSSKSKKKDIEESPQPASSLLQAQESKPFIGKESSTISERQDSVYSKVSITPSREIVAGGISRLSYQRMDKFPIRSRIPQLNLMPTAPRKKLDRLIQYRRWREAMLDCLHPSKLPLTESFRQSLDSAVMEEWALHCWQPSIEGCDQNQTFWLRRDYNTQAGLLRPADFANIDGGQAEVGREKCLQALTEQTHLVMCSICVTLASRERDVECTDMSNLRCRPVENCVGCLRYCWKSCRHCVNFSRVDFSLCITKTIVECWWKNYRHIVRIIIVDFSLCSRKMSVEYWWTSCRHCVNTSRVDFSLCSRKIILDRSYCWSEHCIKINAVDFSLYSRKIILECWWRNYRHIFKTKLVDFSLCTRKMIVECWWKNYRHIVKTKLGDFSLCSRMTIMDSWWESYRHCVKIKLVDSSLCNRKIIVECSNCWWKSCRHCVRIKFVDFSSHNRKFTKICSDCCQRASVVICVLLTSSKKPVEQRVCLMQVVLAYTGDISYTEGYTGHYMRDLLHQICQLVSVSVQNSGYKVQDMSDLTCGPVSVSVQNSGYKVQDMSDLTCGPVSVSVQNSGYNVQDMKDSTCGPVSVSVQNSGCNVQGMKDLTCHSVSVSVQNSGYKVQDMSDLTCRPVSVSVQNSSYKVQDMKDLTCHSVSVSVQNSRYKVQDMKDSTSRPMSVCVQNSRYKVQDMKDLTCWPVSMCVQNSRYKVQDMKDLTCWSVSVSVQNSSYKVQDMKDLTCWPVSVSVQNSRYKVQDMKDLTCQSVSVSVQNSRYKVQDMKDLTCWPVSVSVQNSSYKVQDLKDLTCWPVSMCVQNSRYKVQDMKNLTCWPVSVSVQNSRYKVQDMKDLTCGPVSVSVQNSGYKVQDMKDLTCRPVSVSVQNSRYKVQDMKDLTCLPVSVSVQNSGYKVQDMKDLTCRSVSVSVQNSRYKVQDMKDLTCGPVSVSVQNSGYKVQDMKDLTCQPVPVCVQNSGCKGQDLRGLIYLTCQPVFLSVQVVEYGQVEISLGRELQIYYASCDYLTGAEIYLKYPLDNMETVGTLSSYCVSCGYLTDNMETLGALSSYSVSYNLTDNMETVGALLTYCVSCGYLTDMMETLGAVLSYSISCGYLTGTGRFLMCPSDNLETVKTFQCVSTDNADIVYILQILHSMNSACGTENCNNNSNASPSFESGFDERIKCDAFTVSAFYRSLCCPQSQVRFVQVCKEWQNENRHGRVDRNLCLRKVSKWKHIHQQRRLMKHKLKKWFFIGNLLELVRVNSSLAGRTKLGNVMASGRSWLSVTDSGRSWLSGTDSENTSMGRDSDHCSGASATVSPFNNSLVLEDEPHHFQYERDQYLPEQQSSQTREGRFTEGMWDVEPQLDFQYSRNGITDNKPCKVLKYSNDTIANDMPGNRSFSVLSSSLASPRKLILEGGSKWHIAETNNNSNDQNSNYNDGTSQLSPTNNKQKPTIKQPVCKSSFSGSKKPSCKGLRTTRLLNNKTVTGTAKEWKKHTFHVSSDIPEVMKRNAPNNMKIPTTNNLCGESLLPKKDRLCVHKMNQSTHVRVKQKQHESPFHHQQPRPKRKLPDADQMLVSSGVPRYQLRMASAASDRRHHMIQDPLQQKPSLDYGSQNHEANFIHKEKSKLVMTIRQGENSVDENKRHSAENSSSKEFNIDYDVEDNHSIVGNKNSRHSEESMNVNQTMKLMRSNICDAMREDISSKITLTCKSQTKQQLNQHFDKRANQNPRQGDDGGSKVSFRYCCDDNETYKASATWNEDTTCSRSLKKSQGRSNFRGFYPDTKVIREMQRKVEILVQSYRDFLKREKERQGQECKAEKEKPQDTRGIGSRDSVSDQLKPTEIEATLLTPPVNDGMLTSGGDFGSQTEDCGTSNECLYSKFLEHSINTADVTSDKFGRFNGNNPQKTQTTMSNCGVVTNKWLEQMKKCTSVNSTSMVQGMSRESTSVGHRVTNAPVKKSLIPKPNMQCRRPVLPAVTAVQNHPPRFKGKGNEQEDMSLKQAPGQGSPSYDLLLTYDMHNGGLRCHNLSGVKQELGQQGSVTEDGSQCFTFLINDKETCTYNFKKDAKEDTAEFDKFRDMAPSKAKPSRIPVYLRNKSILQKDHGQSDEAGEYQHSIGLASEEENMFGYSKKALTDLGSLYKDGPCVENKKAKVIFPATVKMPSPVVKQPSKSLKKRSRIPMTSWHPKQYQWNISKQTMQPGSLVTFEPEGIYDIDYLRSFQLHAAAGTNSTEAWQGHSCELENSVIQSTEKKLVQQKSAVINEKLSWNFTSGKQQNVENSDNYHHPYGYMTAQSMNVTGRQSRPKHTSQSWKKCSEMFQKRNVGTHLTRPKLLPGVATKQCIRQINVRRNEGSPKLLHRFQPGHAIQRPVPERNIGKPRISVINQVKTASIKQSQINRGSTKREEDGHATNHRSTWAERHSNLWNPCKEKNILRNKFRPTNIMIPSLGRCTGKSDIPTQTASNEDVVVNTEDSTLHSGSVTFKSIPSVSSTPSCLSFWMSSDTSSTSQPPELLAGSQPQNASWMLPVSAQSADVHSQNICGLDSLTSSWCSASLGFDEHPGLSCLYTKGNKTTYFSDTSGSTSNMKDPQLSKSYSESLYNLSQEKSNGDTSSFSTMKNISDLPFTFTSNSGEDISMFLFSDDQCKCTNTCWSNIQKRASNRKDLMISNYNSSNRKNWRTASEPNLSAMYSSSLSQKAWQSKSVIEIHGGSVMAAEPCMQEGLLRCLRNKGGNFNVDTGKCTHVGTESNQHGHLTFGARNACGIKVDSVQSRRASNHAAKVPVHTTVGAFLSELHSVFQRKNKLYNSCNKNQKEKTITGSKRIKYSPVSLQRKSKRNLVYVCNKISPVNVHALEGCNSGLASSGQCHGGESPAQNTKEKDNSPKDSTGKPSPRALPAFANILQFWEGINTMFSLHTTDKKSEVSGNNAKSVNNLKQVAVREDNPTVFHSTIDNTVEQQCHGRDAEKRPHMSHRKKARKGSLNLAAQKTANQRLISRTDTQRCCEIISFLDKLIKQSRHSRQFWLKETELQGSSGQLLNMCGNLFPSVKTSASVRYNQQKKNSGTENTSTQLENVNMGTSTSHARESPLNAQNPMVNAVSSAVTKIRKISADASNISSSLEFKSITESSKEDTLPQLRYKPLLIVGRSPTSSLSSTAEPAPRMTPFSSVLFSSSESRSDATFIKRKSPMLVKGFNKESGNDRLQSDVPSVKSSSSDLCFLISLGLDYTSDSGSEQSDYKIKETASNSHRILTQRLPYKSVNSLADNFIGYDALESEDKSLVFDKQKTKTEKYNKSGEIIHISEAVIRNKKRASNRDRHGMIMPIDFVYSGNIHCSMCSSNGGVSKESFGEASRALPLTNMVLHDIRLVGLSSSKSTITKENRIDASQEITTDQVHSSELDKLSASSCCGRNTPQFEMRKSKKRYAKHTQTALSVYDSPAHIWLNTRRVKRKKEPVPTHIFPQQNSHTNAETSTVSENYFVSVGKHKHVDHGKDLNKVKCGAGTKYIASKNSIINSAKRPVNNNITPEAQKVSVIHVNDNCQIKKVDCRTVVLKKTCTFSPNNSTESSVQCARQQIGNNHWKPTAQRNGYSEAANLPENTENSKLMIHFSPWKSNTLSREETQRLCGLKACTSGNTLDNKTVLKQATSVYPSEGVRKLGMKSQISDTLRFACDPEYTVISPPWSAMRSRSQKGLPLNSVFDLPQHTLAQNSSDTNERRLVSRTGRKLKTIPSSSNKQLLHGEEIKPLQEWHKRTICEREKQINKQSECSKPETLKPRLLVGTSPSDKPLLKNTVPEVTRHSELSLASASEQNIKNSQQLKPAVKLGASRILANKCAYSDMFLALPVCKRKTSEQYPAVPMWKSKTSEKEYREVPMWKSKTSQEYSSLTMCKNKASEEYPARSMSKISEEYHAMPVWKSKTSEKYPVSMYKNKTSEEDATSLTRHLDLLYSPLSYSDTHSPSLLCTARWPHCLYLSSPSLRQKETPQKSKSSVHRSRLGIYKKVKLEEELLDSKQSSFQEEPPANDHRNIKSHDVFSGDNPPLLVIGPEFEKWKNGDYLHKQSRHRKNAAKHFDIRSRVHGQRCPRSVSFDQLDLPSSINHFRNSCKQSMCSSPSNFKPLKSSAKIDIQTIEVSQIETLTRVDHNEPLQKYTDVLYSVGSECQTEARTRVYYKKPEQKYLNVPSSAGNKPQKSACTPGLTEFSQKYKIPNFVGNKSQKSARTPGRIGCLQEYTDVSCSVGNKSQTETSIPGHIGSPQKYKYVHSSVRNKLKTEAMTTVLKKSLQEYTHVSYSAGHEFQTEARTPFRKKPIQDYSDISFSEGNNSREYKSCKSDPVEVKTKAKIVPITYKSYTADEYLRSVSGFKEENPREGMSLYEVTIPACSQSRLVKQSSAPCLSVISNSEKYKSATNVLRIPLPRHASSRDATFGQTSSGIHIPIARLPNVRINQDSGGMLQEGNNLCMSFSTSADISKPSVTTSSRLSRDIEIVVGNDISMREFMGYLLSSLQVSSAEKSQGEGRKDLSLNSQVRLVVDSILNGQIIDDQNINESKASPHMSKETTKAGEAVPCEAFGAHMNAGDNIQEARSVVNQDLATTHQPEVNHRVSKQTSKDATKDAEAAYKKAAASSQGDTLTMEAETGRCKVMGAHENYGANSKRGILAETTHKKASGAHKNAATSSQRDTLTKGVDTGRCQASGAHKIDVVSGLFTKPLSEVHQRIHKHVSKDAPKKAETGRYEASGVHKNAGAHSQGANITKEDEKGRCEASGTHRNAGGDSCEASGAHRNAGANLQGGTLNKEAENRRCESSGTQRNVVNSQEQKLIITGDRSNKPLFEANQRIPKHPSSKEKKSCNLPLPAMQSNLNQSDCNRVRNIYYRKKNPQQSSDQGSRKKRVYLTPISSEVLTTNVKSNDYQSKVASSRRKKLLPASIGSSSDCGLSRQPSRRVRRERVAQCRKRPKKWYDCKFNNIVLKRETTATQGKEPCVSTPALNLVDSSRVRMRCHKVASRDRIGPIRTLSTDEITLSKPQDCHLDKVIRSDNKVTVTVLPDGKAKSCGPSKANASRRHVSVSRPLKGLNETLLEKESRIFPYRDTWVGYQNAPTSAHVRTLEVSQEVHHTKQRRIQVQTHKTRTTHSSDEIRIRSPQSVEKKKPDSCKGCKGKLHSHTLQPAVASGPKSVREWVQMYSSSSRIVDSSSSTDSSNSLAGKLWQLLDHKQGSTTLTAARNSSSWSSDQDFLLRILSKNHRKKNLEKYKPHLSASDKDEEEATELMTQVTSRKSPHKSALVSLMSDQREKIKLRQIGKLIRNALKDKQQRRAQFVDRDTRKTGIKHCIFKESDSPITGPEIPQNYKLPNTYLASLHKGRDLPDVSEKSFRETASKDFRACKLNDSIADDTVPVLNMTMEPKKFPYVVYASKESHPIKHDDKKTYLQVNDLDSRCAAAAEQLRSVWAYTQHAMQENVMKQPCFEVSELQFVHSSSLGQFRSVSTITDFPKDNMKSCTEDTFSCTNVTSPVSPLRCKTIGTETDLTEAKLKYITEDGYTCLDPGYLNMPGHKTIGTSMESQERSFELPPNTSFQTLTGGRVVVSDKGALLTPTLVEVDGVSGQTSLKPPLSPYSTKKTKLTHASLGVCERSVLQVGIAGSTDGNGPSEATRVPQKSPSEDGFPIPPSSGFLNPRQNKESTGSPGNPSYVAQHSEIKVKAPCSVYTVKNINVSLVDGAEGKCIKLLVPPDDGKGSYEIVVEPEAGSDGLAMVVAENGMVHVSFEKATKENPTAELSSSKAFQSVTQQNKDCDSESASQPASSESESSSVSVDGGLPCIHEEQQTRRSTCKSSNQHGSIAAALTVENQSTARDLCNKDFKSTNKMTRERPGSCTERVYSDPNHGHYETSKIEKHSCLGQKVNSVEMLNVITSNARKSHKPSLHNSQKYDLTRSEMADCKRLEEKGNCRIKCLEISHDLVVKNADTEEMCELTAGNLRSNARHAKMIINTCSEGKGDGYDQITSKLPALATAVGRHNTCGPHVTLKEDSSLEDQNSESSEAEEDSGSDTACSDSTYLVPAESAEDCSHSSSSSVELHTSESTDSDQDSASRESPFNGGKTPDAVKALLTKQAPQTNSVAPKAQCRLLISDSKTTPQLETLTRKTVVKFKEPRDCDVFPVTDWSHMHRSGPHGQHPGPSSSTLHEQCQPMPTVALEEQNNPSHSRVLSQRPHNDPSSNILSQKHLPDRSSGTFPQRQLVILRGQEIEEDRKTTQYNSLANGMSERGSLLKNSKLYQYNQKNTYDSVCEHNMHQAQEETNSVQAPVSDSSMRDFHQPSSSWPHRFTQHISTDRDLYNLQNLETPNSELRINQNPEHFSNKANACNPTLFMPVASEGSAERFLSAASRNGFVLKPGATLDQAHSLHTAQTPPYMDIMDMNMQSMNLISDLSVGLWQQQHQFQQQQQQQFSYAHLERTQHDPANLFPRRHFVFPPTQTNPAGSKEIHSWSSWTSAKGNIQEEEFIRYANGEPIPGLWPEAVPRVSGRGTPVPERADSGYSELSTPTDNLCEWDRSVRMRLQERMNQLL